VEKASRPATMPIKNINQQLQADMNHVTSSISGQKRSLPASLSSQQPSIVKGQEPSTFHALQRAFVKLIHKNVNTSIL
jgi:hypothetical protein